MKKPEKSSGVGRVGSNAELGMADKTWPSSQAMADLTELFGRAKNEPTISLACQECLKLGLPVIVCDIDKAATELTGKFTVHFKLNERLMRVLVAARTGQFENSKCQRVEDGHV